MTDNQLTELLPWYVNGSLSETEHAAVEEFLTRSEDARSEERFLRQLAIQMQSETTGAASELGWRRLQKEIKKESLQDHSSSKQVWWRSGVAVAATVIIALQISILSGTKLDNDSKLLSQGVGSIQQDHWMLQLELDDNLSWLELSEMLASIDARIIDGPSSIGIIRISVSKNQTTFATKQELMNWLRAQAAITHASLESE